MKKELLPKPQPNSEPLPIDATSSPNCTKPNVVCSQSPPIYNSITFVESSSIFQVLYEETKLCVLETGQVVVDL